MNNKAFKCVDFHTHPVTDGFRAAVHSLGIDPIEEDGFPLPQWSVEDQLSFMDEAGIDFSVLTAPVPHLYNGDVEKAEAAAHAVNDEIAGIVKKYPDSFAFAGCVPLPDVDGAIAETRYAMDELGAVGMKVATNMGGIYLGDSLFDPLIEEWDRRGALVIIHPCRARRRPENVITGTVAAIYEYPADTTRAVLNMIANRIMTRFPNIRWLVPHCGAFLPYMLQRFKGVSGILASKGMMDTVDADEEFSWLYFDIAGDPEPAQLQMLRMTVDDGHIVYGSDFPHSPAKVVLAKKKHFDENRDYDGIRERIYSENAGRLLGGAQ
ncbi:MAG: amidohydrolase family protein [Eubacterium sp.]